MLMVIISLVLLIIIIWLILIYNHFVKLRIMTEQAWSDVDVQLRRRHDLIPNLVEIVKGYATYERGVLEEVVRLRNVAMGATLPEKKVEAENMLTKALRHLLAIAENYPDLKSSANFQALQDELSRIEETISQARRYFNAVVRDYNTAISVFPNNLVAGILGFTPKIFFQTEEDTKGVPHIRF